MSSFFSRQLETYNENPLLIQWILDDPLNPLNQISKIINDGTVLDIGCGSGILGRLLKQKSPDLAIDGIDPGVPVDHPGLNTYRNFYSIGIEQFASEGSLAQYDWIVLADVIEHFAYPDEILKILKHHAKPGARIIISTPNIAHLSMRMSLVCGDFDYTPSGILESTHLRFFTLKSIEKMLASINLYPEKILCLNRPVSNAEIITFGSTRFSTMLSLIGNDQLKDTYQFLILCSLTKTTCEIAHIGSAKYEGLSIKYAKEIFKKIRTYFRRQK